MLHLRFPLSGLDIALPAYAVAATILPYDLDGPAAPTITIIQ